MLGAIAGDIIGSRFEWHNHKSKSFELFTDDSCFTDDSVLSVALADSLLSGRSFASKLKEYFCRYPHAGYGGLSGGRLVTLSKLMGPMVTVRLCGSVR